MKFLEEQDIACLKAGYSFDGEKEAFVCPVCGESFDAEEIFCVEGRYLTARRAAALHCENRHGAASAPNEHGAVKLHGISSNSFAHVSLL